MSDCAHNESRQHLPSASIRAAGASKETTLPCRQAGPSNSFARLFFSPKRIWWLTPLATSAAMALQHLAQGAFVRALETVGTGALITMILVGTILAISFLIRKAMQ